MVSTDPTRAVPARVESIDCSIEPLQRHLRPEVAAPVVVQLPFDPQPHFDAPPRGTLELRHTGPPQRAPPVPTHFVSSSVSPVHLRLIVRQYFRAWLRQFVNQHPYGAPARPAPALHGEEPPPIAARSRWFGLRTCAETRRRRR